MSNIRKSLPETFAALRSAGRIGLLPFVPAGYPNLSITAAILPALESSGASVIEIGFPFSDPIADGPVIQEAFTEALATDLRVSDVFQSIASVRTNLSLPLVAMVSYSIIFRYGQTRFLDDAQACGFDGLIIPDLPPPEAADVCDAVRAVGLDTILLVAPTTPQPRRAQIVNLCSGFVYYLSVTGTTGERGELPRDLVENLKQIRSISDCPVCVGFGISKPEHVAGLRGIADGAIVGSALVRQIKAHLSEPPDQIAHDVADFCRALCGD